jgi:hypothetical protein
VGLFSKPLKNLDDDYCHQAATPFTALRLAVNEQPAHAQSYHSCPGKNTL